MRRKTQGFTLIEIMVVIAIIAGLIGTVAIIVPQMQERQRKLQCLNNLSQLGQTFTTKRLEKPGRSKYVGAALWLYYRSVTSDIKEGQEAVLICPGDEGIAAADSPEAKARYSNVDLTNPPEDLCSYASRDFLAHPLENESKKLQLIGCDRNGPTGRIAHHKNGLNVAFEDGSTKFIEREELGISPEDPIVVGPDSPNEMLKQVIYIKHSGE